MEVVSMLNAMYSLFDTLTERNRVYKVFFRYWKRYLDLLFVFRRKLLNLI